MRNIDWEAIAVPVCATILIALALVLAVVVTVKNNGGCPEGSRPEKYDCRDVSAHSTSGDYVWGESCLTRCVPR